MSRLSLPLALVLLLSPAAAQAGEPAQGAPGPGPASSAGAPPATPPAASSEAEDARLRKELEAALQADVKDKGAAPGSATAAPLAVSPARAQSSSPLVRGMQSLNPDLSAIVDAAGGFATHPPAWSAGDDPALPQHSNGQSGGFTVQEVEVALSAIVDPYLKGEVYLTIPNLGGLEVEEAVATTTSLPWNLQVRAGSFRSAFGRQNGQHLHVQDFATRPLVNAAFLGPDGLRGPGAQVSWLAPLPFFLTLYLEGFSLPETLDGPIATFGSTQGGGLTGAAHAKAFLPLTDELSVYAGLSAAAGHTPGARLLGPGGDILGQGGDGGDSELLGGDLYVKWKPSNEAGGYFSLAWQSEAIFRHRGSGAAVSGALVRGPGDAWDGGFYSQLLLHLSRRLFLGLRADVLGVPSSTAVPRTLRGTASLTFQMSEFARLRLQAWADHYPSPTPVPRFAPDPALAGLDGRAVLLQLELSIGAHGAHAF